MGMHVYLHMCMGAYVHGCMHVCVHACMHLIFLEEDWQAVVSCLVRVLESGLRSSDKIINMIFLSRLLLIFCTALLLPTSPASLPLPFRVRVSYSSINIITCVYKCNFMRSSLFICINANPLGLANLLEIRQITCLLASISCL